MKHSFLLQPARWTATGFIFDEKGNPTATEGITSVIHGSQLWEIHGRLTVLGNPPMEFENDYRIAPLAPGETFTQWTSTNSALGPLKGMFSLVENSILSSFSSSEGRYTGVEVLNQRGETTYEARGTLYHGNTQISAWSAKLIRME